MSRALVISGGGSKGAFAVGVLKKLFSVFPKLDFDLYVGTSTGALIVPLAATRDISMLEQLYTTQKTENIIIKGNIGDRLNTDGIFDTTPLWGLINRYISDDRYAKIRNSVKKLYLVTTCLQTSGTVVFTPETRPVQSSHYAVRTTVSADQFRKAVLASASVPVVMPPVKVNSKVPGEPFPWYQFVDGGVREYAGVQMAIDNGATEIFTILLSMEQAAATPATEYKSLFPLLLQTLDIYQEDVSKNDVIIPQVYNAALTYIDAVKAKMIKGGIPKNQVESFFADTGRANPFAGKTPLKLYFIRPTQPLGGGPNGLNFDPVEMKEMVRTGERVTGDFIARLDPGDITWV